MRKSRCYEQLIIAQVSSLLLRDLHVLFGRDTRLGWVQRAPKTYCACKYMYFFNQKIYTSVIITRFLPSRYNRTYGYNIQDIYKHCI